MASETALSLAAVATDPNIDNTSDNYQSLSFTVDKSIRARANPGVSLLKERPWIDSDFWELSLTEQFVLARALIKQTLIPAAVVT